jgi:hypothetical protein
MSLYTEECDGLQGAKIKGVTAGRLPQVAEKSVHEIDVHVSDSESITSDTGE